MDVGSLQTASQYVNNILLARGLLRDGVSIDFAAPAKSGHETTTANVINLVHDLVLRRDRESENLTALSQSLQDLRTRTTQSNQELSKLDGEKAALQRELSVAKSQARQATAELKAVESKNKAYKDDIQRLRISVGQIRAQCANDNRKRDTEITRLKKHIDVRRTRDSKSHSEGPGGVTIIDGTTGKTHYPSNSAKADSKATRESSSSLQSDTQEYLTALNAGLSDSNGALLHLVQTTTATLRTLQGQSAGIAESANSDKITRERPMQPSLEPAIHIAEVPDVAFLSSQLNETLSSLRILLTNPSFAPIEEVEIREAELERLRSGWEIMESRWQEAVGLMSGWRHKMVDTDGGVISLDDIQQGIDMAEEVLSVAGSPVQRKRGRKWDSTASEAIGADASVLSVDSDVSLDRESPAHQDTPKVKRARIQRPEAGAGLFPAPHVLKPTCGNKRRSPSPKQIIRLPEEPNAPKDTPTPAQRHRETPSAARDEMMSPDIWVEPVLTVAQKLQEVQAEAEETGKQDAIDSSEGNKQANKPVKRSAVPRKTKSKRRSTLTPAELNGLMGVTKR